MYSELGTDNSSKRRKCFTYLILIGIAGLVGLGFVIASLTIAGLDKMNHLIENYSSLTSNLKDVILEAEKILDDAVRELPAINSSISKLSSILTWICKQNPDINC